LHLITVNNKSYGNAFWKTEGHSTFFAANKIYQFHLKIYFAHSRDISLALIALPALLLKNKDVRVQTLIEDPFA
jgi:hypothetical protein